VSDANSSRPGGGTLKRLRRRLDFVRAAKGVRAHAESLILQAAARQDATGPRLGFTITRKLGGAVIRNRIRRRLKAAAAKAQPIEWEGDTDYVVVARLEALRRSLPALIDDLQAALRRVRRERMKRRDAEARRPDRTDKD